MKAPKFIWATSLCVALGMGIVSCGENEETLDGNVAGTEAEHEYVDLGLSVKWATCNVGASSPEEYGDYYAWGETETKSTYDWNTYKWCKGSENTLTKYCTDSDYGTVDNKTVLELSDDVAHEKWGGSWRMPTKQEFIDLIQNTNTILSQGWPVKYGVYVRGYWIRGIGNYSKDELFIPTVGYFDSTGITLDKMYGIGTYWTSELGSDGYPVCAKLCSKKGEEEEEYYSGSDELFQLYEALERHLGALIRPICE